ncbi:MAG: tetratricopeptide repeat protein [Bacteroidota bacterium]
MNKIYLAIPIIVLLTVVTGNSQSSDILNIINEGTSLHDQGNYKAAIEKYNEALKINPKSSTALYEIAYSLFAMNDFKTSIEYCNKTLKIDKNHQDAYVVMGSSYDMSGDVKKSIKTYKKGLKRNPQSYLLQFNLGLSYMGLNDYSKAEKCAIKAIELNNSHSSSHLLLTNLHYIQYNRVKSLLAAYFFLLLEPNSSRSEKVLTMITEQLNQGVEKTSDTQINVNINASEKEKEFQAADMMLSMLSASRIAENEKNRSEIVLFKETSESFFNILAELMKAENKDFYWDFYVKILSGISKAGHIEAYTYYISQSKQTNEIEKWFEENPEKMEDFRNWILN